MKKRVQVSGLLVAALLLCLGLSVPVAWGAACGSISGTVTDESGPVLNVPVNVYDAGNHVLVGSGTSNMG